MNEQIIITEEFKDAIKRIKELGITFRGDLRSFSERAGYGAPHQFGTAYYESFPDQKAADAK